MAAGRFAEGKPDFVMPGTGRLAIKRQAKQPAKDFAAFMKLLLPLCLRVFGAFGGLFGF